MHSSKLVIATLSCASFGGLYACAAETPSSPESTLVASEAVAPAAGLWGYELSLDSIDGVAVDTAYAAFAARGLKRTTAGIAATTQTDHAGQWYSSPVIPSRQSHAVAARVDANGDRMSPAAPLTLGDFTIANDGSEFLRVYGILDVYNVVDDTDWPGDWARPSGPRSPISFAQYEAGYQGSEASFDPLLLTLGDNPIDQTPITERMDPRYAALMLHVDNYDHAVWDCSVAMAPVFKDYDGATLYALTDNASQSYSFKMAFGPVPHYGDWHYEGCGAAPQATYNFTFRRVMGTPPPLGSVTPGDCTLKTVNHLLDPAQIAGEWGETSDPTKNTVDVSLSWNNAAQGYDIVVTEAAVFGDVAPVRVNGIKPSLGTDFFQFTTSLAPHMTQLGSPFRRPWGPPTNGAFPSPAITVPPVSPICRAFSLIDPSTNFAFDGVTPHGVEALTLSPSARLELWGEYDAMGRVENQRIRYVRSGGMTSADVMLRRTVRIF